MFAASIVFSLINVARHFCSTTENQRPFPALLFVVFYSPSVALFLFFVP